MDDQPIQIPGNGYLFRVTTAYRWYDALSDNQKTHLMPYQNLVQIGVITGEKYCRWPNLVGGAGPACGLSLSGAYHLRTHIGNHQASDQAIDQAIAKTYSLKTGGPVSKEQWEQIRYFFIRLYRRSRNLAPDIFPAMPALDGPLNMDDYPNPFTLDLPDPEPDMQEVEMLWTVGGDYEVEEE